MAEIEIRAEKGGLYFRRDSGLFEQVVKIDTTSRSYFVDSSKVGDAIRSGTPILKVQWVSKAGPAPTITGDVEGHPKRDDGSRMMATITNFILASGENVPTDLGKSIGGRAIAQVLGTVAPGSSPA